MPSAEQEARLVLGIKTRRVVTTELSALGVSQGVERVALQLLTKAALGDDRETQTEQVFIFRDEFIEKVIEMLGDALRELRENRT